MQSLPFLLTLRILTTIFTTITTDAQKPKSTQVSEGDECGSGFEFPLEFKGVEYVGCKVIAGTLWCQVPEDNTFLICPPDFLADVEDDLNNNIIGDECGSGESFPLEVEGVEYTGCTIQSRSLWCQQRGGLVTVCPETEFLNASLVPDGNEYFGTVGQKVQISEIMANNEGNIEDEDGEFSDWIELHNLEEEEVSMEGWYLTDTPRELTMWEFPDDLLLEPDEYFVVFASGKDRIDNRTFLHTNFRMKTSGEYLGLVRKDGSVASAMAPSYPRQLEDISYGIPTPTQLLKNSNFTKESGYAFLQEATPGEPNSGPRLEGPLITRTVQNVDPPPREDEDIIVSATIQPNVYDMTEVNLAYRVNFEKEVKVKMNDAGKAGDGIKSDGVYTATIPSKAYRQGDMVRWFIQASDTNNKSSRDPPFHTFDSPFYYGTVVVNASLKSPLPILQWFTESPEQSISVNGSRGAVYFDGLFYDNIFTRRRGVTALAWPKPKIKMDFKGKVFRYSRNEKRVEEFNLQSFWEEPGEDSYLREVVAFQVLREAGVPASKTIYLRVVLNKQYFGLFAFVEQVDDVFLSRNGFDAGGSLFKSSHGELTNLRWDTPDVRWTYRKGNRRDVDDWYLLTNLTTGIAGGGPGTRSEYLFDNLNLPEIVNEMAVQTMMLNQDRCTKNFYMYYYEKTAEWYRIPWDMEGAFGISSRLGEVSTEGYCMLACEQWNSPLYCDSDHPQDIEVNNILWGGAQAPLTTPLRRGRKLHITGTIGSKLVSTLGISTNRSTQTIPSVIGLSTIFLDFDEDLTQGNSLIGAPGTYNHLVDAILNVPWTREMYLRRLRSVSDRFLDGYLNKIITTQYTLIRSEALKDNQLWETANVDRGYKQLITEQIPIRKEQLYEKYGPKGETQLLPEAQPTAPVVTIAKIFSVVKDKKTQYIRLDNENKFAVDISGWEIKGSVTFVFRQGTVIPTEYSVYLTPDLKGFRSRLESPTKLERNFVVGPWEGILPAKGWILKLYDDKGNKIDEVDQD